MSTHFRRMLLAGLPPLVAAGPAVVVLARDWARIPETVASHFTFSGTADGTGGRALLLLLAVGVPVLLAVVFGGIAVAPAARAGRRMDPARAFVGLSWATGVLVGGLTLLVVLANRDATDPLAVRLPGGEVGLLLVAVVVAGVIGALLTPSSPAAPDESGGGPVLRLGPTERASWTGRAASWPLTALSAALLLAGPLAGMFLTWAAGIPLTAAGILVLWCSAVRVTVDERGLGIGVGPFGVPRLRIPQAEIADARVEDVAPLAYGGWGLRFVNGTTGVVLRSGPGIVVSRRSGRRLVVTVDDAATGAALLNGLRERAC